LKGMRQTPRLAAMSPGRVNFGSFDPASIRPSAQRSLDALQTNYLDCLMLHEPRLSDPNSDVESSLRELVRDGQVRRLGVGTYSDLECLPVFGDVSQFALSRSALALRTDRLLIGHGLLRSFDGPRFESGARRSGVFDLMPALAVHVREPLDSSALLLNAMVLGSDIDRILLSSSSPVRLQQFMASTANIFGEVAAGPMEKLRPAFGEALRHYFSEHAQAGGVAHD
jgi:hypothetical protein